MFFFFKQKTAYEMRMSDWSSDVCSSDLLVPIAGGYGYYLGNGAGEAQGYARARDETAAASWANTTNGKLARRIDQASEQTIPAIAACPKDHGWKREKRDRSEEHTSELQSLMRISYAVFCLKKKKKRTLKENIKSLQT